MDLGYDSLNVKGGNMFFRNDGNTRMTLTTDGKLGIGTTSPSYKLDVNGEIKSDGYRIDLSATTQRAITSTGTDSIQFGDAGVNEFKFKNAAGTSVIINSSGNVGIGTTSPLATLTVGSGTGSLNTSAELFVPNNDALMRSLKIGHGSSVATITTDDSSKPMAFNSGGSERMRIKNDGNVGIGTTSPSTKLEVNAGADNLVAQFESTDPISEIRLKDSIAYSRLLNVGTQLKLMPNNGVEMMILDGNDNTVNIPDSKKITFGDSDDLEIYHNGSHSYISGFRYR